MDVRFELALTPEDEAFRDEIRAFLDANLPPKWGTSGFKAWSTEREQVAFVQNWQHELNRARLAAISWPEEFGGRDATPMQQIVYAQEMSHRSAPDGVNKGAISRGGPIIIQFGTDWQRERFLLKMLSGEEVWCQGFSEPDAGSDLASLKTRAVLEGDEYAITGQKIWTTRAHLSDWCFLLARTDPDAPKHRGITYFLVDMKSPGVTVRPLKQITGRSEFNEVFFDEVHVPRTQVVGEPNRGWQVATTFLNYERASLGDTTRLELRLQRVTRLAMDTVIDGRRRLDDPIIRDKLVRFAARVEALRQMGWNTTVSSLLGAAPGPESAFVKMLWSETDQGLADLAMDIAGAYGVLTAGSPHAIKGGNVPLSYLIMRAATIGGGTSEVQRNIIGERVLGLPKS
jgi:alkylation response protein AidB-like acyl-CoA dehydrogenase